MSYEEVRLGRNQCLSSCIECGAFVSQEAHDRHEEWHRVLNMRVKELQEPSFLQRRFGNGNG